MSNYTPYELCVEHCRKEKESLTISVRRNGESKFCLGAELLSMLRNPEWLRFGVNPTTSQLAIFPTAKTKYAAQVVTNEEGIAEISGTIFIQKLCDLNYWPYESAYCLKGEFTKVDDRFGVLFDMKSAQKLEEPVS